MRFAIALAYLLAIVAAIVYDSHNPPPFETALPWLKGSP